MPVEIFNDDDADLSIVQQRKVVVVGYGSQARAHALCLRDSGVDVRVGLAEGSAVRGVAESDGLRVLTPADAVGASDLVMVLAPDSELRRLYAHEIEPNIDEGDALFFGDGFHVHFGYIKPPPGVDVALVAPTEPGDLVRSQFVDGKGVPALVAVKQDASGAASELALSYAKGIGATRAGVIRTTIAEETEARLFGSQAVAGGGVAQLVRSGFEVLVDAGFAPEIAYLQCLHALKRVVDAMYADGIVNQRWSSSEAAEFGAHVSGPRVVDSHVAENMRMVLRDIRSGEFAARFTADQENGAADLNALRAKAEGHVIEVVGRRIRELMSWLVLDTDG